MLNVIIYHNMNGLRQFGRNQPIYKDTKKSFI